MKINSLITIAVLVIGLAGCGAVVQQPNTPATPPVNEAPVLQAPAVTSSVAITNFAYSPATLTVKKGTTVTWTNNDAVAHTVTSDNGSELASSLFKKGETYTHTFNTVGTFNYYCQPHPNMRGSVVVTE